MCPINLRTKTFVTQLRDRMLLTILRVLGGICACWLAKVAGIRTGRPQRQDRKGEETAFHVVACCASKPQREILSGARTSHRLLGIGLPHSFFFFRYQSAVS